MAPFLGCGRGAASARRRRYAGWQFDHTSTGSDAAVERTVNTVLQVAQTTSIRWVSGCWVKARGHVPSLTPRTLCEEYPHVRQEQLGVLKQRAVPRVRVDDQLGIGDVLG